MDFIIPFEKISINDVNIVGGKNASLGEMIQQLTQKGIRVPGGFATTTEAYCVFLNENNLTEVIYPLLEKLDIHNLKQLNEVSSDIQKKIMNAKFSQKFRQEITLAYDQLTAAKKMSMAVRSSATAEDLPEASFAGQQETFLNVQGAQNILQAIKKVYASLFTPRSITYRVNNQFAHEKVAISAGIQHMIRSDNATSGVTFTLDTESGFREVVFITAGYGLGELIVQGAVNPDAFYVFKPLLKLGKPAIISRKVGSKSYKMIYAKNKNRTGVKRVKTSLLNQQQFCLTDIEILQLAKMALIIEEHYGKPMDIEWAKDGEDGNLYIVQARPETVKSRQSPTKIERYILKEKSTIKTQGQSVGHQISSGTTRLILKSGDLDVLQEGEILVTDTTNPDWEPIMKKAKAIITDHGGRTCHAAIVARELGIPAIVGCGNATKLLQDGESITVSCAEGASGYVYAGILAYNVEHIEIKNMPEISVKIAMNLANPEQAYNLQFLPNDGIGLARLEFIIGNLIGIHPNAVLKFSDLPISLKNRIRKETSAYPSPVEFYISKLCEGIATIGAAFYPKLVIVRFSDFKSNEYAHLLGGGLFEPKEENPMLGFRGGSRYINDRFRECFALECQAIHRVREDMGLTNVQVMLPFVRTVEEATRLIGILKDFGLERGKNGLKIYMMCEIPSNVLLADEFLALFDGFSIGSNDLTQLTLGLDRDSELVANIFDERNQAVKILLHQAILAAKRQNKYIGICGQAPSDYPELAHWLMQEGITSISLNPDSIVSTWLNLAKKSP